jgi:hypothetical protein
VEVIVETQQRPDGPRPTLTPNELRARSIRAGVGAVVGCYVGGMIGYLIDSALTSDPYAGVRLGLFLGGLVGGTVIGSGTGWRGGALVLCVVGCMTVGAFAALAVANPDPNSFAMLVPAAIGVTLGLFVGLALAVALGRVLFRPRPTAGGTP